MRVKSHGSNYKRFKRSGPSFTNYQISIVKSSNIASLKNQCLAKLTQIISQSYDSQLHKFLPTELVENLMTHLAFQNLLNDRALLALTSPKLTTLRLSNANKTIRPSPEAIDRAVKICTSIQVLDLSDCIIKEDTIDFLCTNEHYVNNLRVLDLSSTNLNPAAICRIIQSLDRLERLYLSGTNLTDEAFETLYINTAVRPLLAAKSASSPSSPSHGTKRKREETEDIEDIIDYYQYDDPYPSRRDPSRDVLDADQCSSLCGPLSSFVKNLAQGRSSSRYRPPQSPCDVCSVAFCEGAPRKFPNLSKLVVSGCERLTSKGISFIGRLFPLLTSFDCSHCPQVTDIYPIVFGCQHLKVLTVDGCPISVSDSSEVQDNWAKFPNSLRFLRKFKFSGTGVLEASFNEWFSRFEHLSELSLRNKDIGIGITSNDIIKNSKRLQKLDIYGVACDPSFIELLLNENNNVRSLEVMDLTQTNISAQMLAASLAKTRSWPSLNSLSLTKYSNEEDFGGALKAIGQVAPNIEHLCVNISTVALTHENELSTFIGAYPNLSRLELWSCNNVSFDIILNVMNACPKLTSLLMCRGQPEATSPCLLEPEFELLKIKHPQVEFKLWNHSIYGNRHFQYYEGSVGWMSRGAKFSSERPVVNRLRVDVDLISKSLEENLDATTEGDEFGRLVKTTIYVDDIPIWANENGASISHLQVTADGNSGALPIIDDWCCGCNIDNFNGLLYYHTDDSNNGYMWEQMDLSPSVRSSSHCVGLNASSKQSHFVIWETHEPGSKRRFCFDKEQYRNVIKEATNAHNMLLKALRRREISVLARYCSTTILDLNLTLHPLNML